MTVPDLMTAEDVAKRLQLSVNYVYVLMARGDIAVTSIGRKRRISEESLAEFIASRTAAPRRARKGTAA